MNRLFAIVIISMCFLIACGDEEAPETPTGQIEIIFDNVVGTRTGGLLTDPGSEEYPFINEKGQSYNLTLVKYIISEIVLEGSNGEYHADPMDVSVDELKGYYLVDESNKDSQNIILEGIPPGTYNKISFLMGVSEEGVTQGTGIFLDGMFWTWNSGYIAFKIEGQSPDSYGDSFGDTIEETNPYGFGYHIGGWDAINNNQNYTLPFDPLLIDYNYFPGVHIVMNISEMFDGPNEVDFSEINSVHSPAAGVFIAENMDDLFVVDHAHQ